MSIHAGGVTTDHTADVELAPRQSQRTAGRATAATCRAAPAGSTRARENAQAEVIEVTVKVDDNGPDEGKPGVRLVLDLNRCQAYAQCVFLAPDVFELRGNEAVHCDPNPDDTQRLRVLRAAAASPVQAIQVEQLDETEAGETT